MSLYNEVRPTKFEDMEGDHTGLAKMLKRPEHNHSFLFTGPVGCGKTAAALIMQQLLQIVSYDVHKLGCDEKTGIDKVREFLGDMYSTSFSGGFQLFLLDECHRLSSAAQNALLVPLEFPPEKVYFILCSSAPEDLLPAIRSRCYIEHFPPLTDLQLLCILRDAVMKKDIKVSDALFPAIIQAAQGSGRTALNILESIRDVPEAEQEAKIASSGLTTDAPEAIDLCRALYNKKDWDDISRMLKALLKNKEDPEKIRHLILSYGQTMLLNKIDSNTQDIMKCFSRNYYDTKFPGLTISCFDAYMHKGMDIGF